MGDIVNVAASPSLGGGAFKNEMLYEILRVVGSEYDVCFLRPLAHNRCRLAIIRPHFNSESSGMALTILYQDAHIVA
ncbi:MAG: hypothetical protein RPR40_03180, partial [Bermanella sp.]